MARRDGRLGVGIIGTAPIGPVLANALAGAGHALIGIAAEDEHARERVEAIVPDAPILDEAHIVERSELVVLACDDDELPGLVERLTEAHAWVQGQLVLHTAPGYGTAILARAFDAGVIPLAVHPAFDVTGTSLDLTRLRETWCAVTAPRPVLPIAQALVVELGGEPVIIAEEDRATYADALAAATSFTRSVIKQSTEALAGIGVETPGFLISSLVRSAVDNALADASPHLPEPDDFVSDDL